MKLPLHIAKKLQQLLLPAQAIPSSAMVHGTVTKMLADGLLQKRHLSKTKAVLFIANKENVDAYLQNHFGIKKLDEYIRVLENPLVSRHENISSSGDSKLQPVRTFTGFLINCYEDINAVINGQKVIIRPPTGTYTFIHSYQNFVPEAGVTIVGIENPENFACIDKQQYLFKHIKPLFVSRYPLSGDLIKWLASIPNHYLHFGDLDLAGIRIYQTEYKKTLLEKASFFVPVQTESLLQKFGNRELFNRQYSPVEKYSGLGEKAVEELLSWILTTKRVLEQEIFIETGH